MAKKVGWPNVVTLVRLGLVGVLVLLVYGDGPIALMVAGVLALAIVIGNWLDGHLARKLGLSSALGSVLDIVADRILENVMWVVLADLRLIPIWIPIIAIPRGIITDGIRNYALSLGYSGFGKKSLQQSRVGRFLTGSPLMRTPYAVLKAFTFTWLLIFAALKDIVGASPTALGSLVQTALHIGCGTAVVSAMICVVRGVPVVVEGIGLIRREAGNGDQAGAVGH